MLEQFSCHFYSSEAQVFPSSFSIAALIGAAAIRERVVTNLRLNSQQEEETAGRDSQTEFKRKLSGELNPDDEQDSDLDNDIKKPKIEDETNSLVRVSQPKIVNLKENPIFDQIKLANCFLRDQSLIKAQRSWEREDDTRGQQDNKLSSPAGLISSMSVSSPGNSTSAGDFNQKNSSSAGKQSVVNSNTKLLEKVRFLKTRGGRFHKSAQREFNFLHLTFSFNLLFPITKLCLRLCHWYLT